MSILVVFAVALFIMCVVTILILAILTWIADLKHKKELKNKKKS